MADETVAVAEPVAPKMRVRLMLSHPTNTQPKVKMAKVDGCAFFKRGDNWVHVSNACKKANHWIWTMTLQVGQCVLVREGGQWRHQGQQTCAEAKAYLEAQDKANEATKALDAEAAKAEGEKKLDEKTKMELTLALKKFGCMAKSACLLEASDTPAKVAGSEFAMVGDVFHIVGGPRSKQAIYYQDFGTRRARLTRSPGRDINEFTKSAIAAIGRALAPGIPAAHLSVEA